MDSPYYIKIKQEKNKGKEKGIKQKNKGKKTASFIKDIGP